MFQRLARTALTFLIAALAGWYSAAGQSAPVETTLDIQMLNDNFDNLLKFRINTFPRQDFIKNIRQALNKKPPDYEIKFVSEADYLKSYFPKGINAKPFVVGRTIFFVIDQASRSKIEAILDRGNPDYDRMQRVTDVFILWADAVLGGTSQKQREEILKVFEEISKMRDDKKKLAAVAAALNKNLSIVTVLQLFNQLVSRYGTIYPKYSIIEDASFVFGRDLRDPFGQILSFFWGEQKAPPPDENVIDHI